jgi:peroxiredoxin family protein
LLIADGNCQLTRNAVAAVIVATVAALGYVVSIFVTGSERTRNLQVLLLLLLLLVMLL